MPFCYNALYFEYKKNPLKIQDSFPFQEYDRIEQSNGAPYPQIIGGYWERARFFFAP